MILYRHYIYEYLDSLIACSDLEWLELGAGLGGLHAAAQLAMGGAVGGGAAVASHRAGVDLLLI